MKNPSPIKEVEIDCAAVVLLVLVLISVTRLQVVAYNLVE